MVLPYWGLVIRGHQEVIKDVVVVIVVVYVAARVVVWSIINAHTEA